MDDYSNFYPSFLQNMKSGGDFNFQLQLDGLEGKDVYINDSLETERIVLQIYTNPLNRKIDDYKIMTKLDTEIKLGDYIKFDDEEYILLTKPQINIIYKYAEIEYCSKKLKWVDDNGLHEYSCMVVDTTATDTINTTESVITQNFPYRIIVQSNEYTKALEENVRFIFGRNVYKIVKIEDSYKDGLLYIGFDVDQKNIEKDNFVDGIAYNEDYSIKIIQDDITQNVGYTTTLSTKLYKNNVEVTDSYEVQWTSGDELVAIVSDVGEVELLSEGLTNIVASFGDVGDSINIEVNALINENIDILISPNINTITQDDGDINIEVQEFINNIESVSPSLIIDYKVLSEGVDITTLNGADFNYEIVGNVISFTNTNIVSGELILEVTDGLTIKEFKINLSIW